MKKNDKYMGTVKLGPKGQIVIPKEVREMFGLAPGDLLILLADQKKGVALQKYTVFSKIADAIFAGHGEALYPEESEENRQVFAESIKKLQDEEGEK